MATIAAPARSSRRAEKRRGHAARGAVLPVSCERALSSIVCAALICSPRTTIRLRYGLCVRVICNLSRKASEFGLIAPAITCPQPNTAFDQTEESGTAARAVELGPISLEQGGDQFTPKTLRRSQVG